MSGSDVSGKRRVYLTQNQKAEMCRLFHEAGVRAPALAATFGVGRRTVYEITGPVTDGTRAARFWRNVDSATDPDGCWVWAGCTDSAGYAPLSFNGRTDRAHRVAIMLHTGRLIPHGMFVLHSCDNPPCCNPKHLRVGTHQDNMRDMMSRNRNAFGERSGPSKLKTAEVEEILRATKVGSATCAELGVMFGVSHRSILDITCGKTWAHIPRP